MRCFSFISIICCLLVTGCHKKSSSPPVEKVIRLSLKNEPSTLDPRKGGDVISSHMHFLLFEGLVKLNPDRSISMAQAETLQKSEDGLVYTFTLRNTFWSNGLPVTAYDFEKSWKDILSPSFPSPNAHLLYPIKNAEKAKKGLVSLDTVGIQALDNKTLIVTLETPTPYFLELISFCVFFPVCSQVDTENPSWAYHAGEQFVSNGPFLLSEWKHNDKILAAKNPLYWNQEQTRPDWIDFSIIENEMTALQLFEKGALDMIGDPISSLPVEALPSLKEKWKVQKFPVGATTILSFHIDRFPFNNVKIRKALSYAINGGTIIQNILQTDEIPALGAVPPILKRHQIRNFFQDANTVLARKLLKEGMEELGITEEAFSHLTYFYSSSEKNHKVAQAIQQQWKEVLGINIPIENLEFKVLMDKLSKRQYDLAQSLWVAQYNDQMNILERFKFKTNVKNYANWENPEYIQLLNESCYAEGECRERILEKAEMLFLDEMPICPIYHWDMNYIVQPYLSDVNISPIGDLVFNKLNLATR